MNMINIEVHIDLSGKFHRSAKSREPNRYSIYIYLNNVNVYRIHYLMTYLWEFEMEKYK